MKERKNGSFTIGGDTLVYRVTGKGAPLLLIAGGGGDGDLFLPLADKLFSQYKVITYDRRANASSTMNHPDQFSLKQQAEDAVALLQEVGESSAYILGNSSGAVIAMEILKRFPDHVKGVIAHEPPIAKAHPEKDKWLDFFEKCYAASFKPGGASMAATKFLFGIEVPVVQMVRAQLSAESYLKKNRIGKERMVSSKQASKYLIQQELLPVVRYDVDVGTLKNERAKIVFAVGEYAERRHTFLYQVAARLSELSGAPCAVVPGHHGSFMDDPEHWAEAVEKIILNHFKLRKS